MQRYFKVGQLFQNGTFWNYFGTNFCVIKVKDPEKNHQKHIKNFVKLLVKTKNLKENWERYNRNFWKIAGFLFFDKVRGYFLISIVEKAILKMEDCANICINKKTLLNVMTLKVGSMNTIVIQA